MIGRIHIEKIGRRISWLKELLYRPFQEIDLQIAGTREHRRDLNVQGLTFSPIDPKTVWGEEGASAWFRGSYVLKEEDRERKLLLAMDTGGESLVYIDGEEAGAIDRQHREIPLSTEESSPHQHQILIESYAGHRVPDVDPKPLKLKRGAWVEPPFLYPFPPVYMYCRLVERDTRAWELYYHLETLYAIAQELPEDSMRRHHLFKALNQAVDSITWETHDYKKRNNDFTKAFDVLKPELLKRNSPTTPLLNLIGHAHIDIAWLWPLKETIRKCGRTFATQLRMIEEYPEYIFLQSQARAYSYVEEHYPQLFQRMKRAIQAGNWEVEGGMWVEADTNVPSLESLIRQFLLGKSYFKETFGVDSRVLWLPDVFGYSGNLPQILKGCGVDYFITSKIGWNDTNRFPYDLFLWRGIDGSEVLAHFIKETYNGDTHPASIVETYRAFQQKELTDRIIHSVGYGDGGGGITMEHLEYARRLKDLEGSPKVEFGSVQRLMDYFHEKREKYPIWQGELYLEYHRGTLTSQAQTKRDNRQLEILLKDTEFFSSLAYLKGSSYQEERLHHCWQELLTNQFHDILPGSSIHEVYEDCHRIYGGVARDAYDVFEDSLKALEGSRENKRGDLRGDRKEVQTIKVWNTLSFERSHLIEVPLMDREDRRERIGDYTPLKKGLSLPSSPIHVYDERGRNLYHEIHHERLFFDGGPIPGSGYRTFTIERGGSPVEERGSSITATPSLLMNEHLRVEIDDSGRLASVYDRDNHRELLPEGERGNTLILAEDLPLDYDAWDIEHYYHDVEKRVKGPVSVERVFSSFFEAHIEWRRRLGEASSISQKIVLHRGSRRIDFLTEIDWHERHRLLKVAFPLDVQTDRGIYEIQGGLLERPIHENTSWDQARFEVCGHRWGALMEMDYGVAILNDCKYGYEGLPKELRLTLLKSATGPDVEADRGRHTLTYSLFPFKGSLLEGRVVEEGYALNTPYIVQLCGGLQRESESFFVIKGEGVILLTVKKAEREEGLILRLYEAYGRTTEIQLELPCRVSRVIEVNMIEEKLQKIDEEVEEISLLFKPFAIRTFLLKGLDSTLLK